jgi:chromosome segregation ATPase
VLDGRLVILNDKRKTICADLRDNLGRRKEELELRLSDLEDQTHEQEETKGKSSKRKKSAGKGKTSKESEAISLDLQYVEKFLGEVEVEISEIDQRLHEIRVEVSKQELAIDSLRKDESRLEDAVEEGLKSQDRLLNKRNLFYENSEEKRRLIRELGSLPRKELDEYNRYSETRLLSTLREVNDHLKSYKGSSILDTSPLISWNCS